MRFFFVKESFFFLSLGVTMKSSTKRSRRKNNEKLHERGGREIRCPTVKGKRQRSSSGPPTDPPTPVPKSPPVSPNA